MKRSHALILIANQLDFLNGHFRGVRLEVEPDELVRANVILVTLEQAGMIVPPGIWRKHDWHEKGLTYAQWIQLPSIVNEWEPENEEARD